MNLKSKIKPRNLEKKQKKKDILKNLYALFDDRERVLDAFESKICLIKIEGTGFSDKVLDHSNRKILTPKQMLQRLPIPLAKVKGGNIFENFLNEISQIIYSLCGTKEITKKVYKNTMNSTNL